MRGEATLTGKTQFELVYDKGRTWVAREMVLKTLPNGLDSNRFGLTVSRRIGKAVIRNKIKRRLREILRRTDLPCGWDIIIIARGPASDADYTTLERSVQKVFKQAGLLLGENEANSPRIN